MILRALFANGFRELRAHLELNLVRSRLFRHDIPGCVPARCKPVLTSQMLDEGLFQRVPHFWLPERISRAKAFAFWSSGENSSKRSSVASCCAITQTAFHDGEVHSGTRLGGILIEDLLPQAGCFAIFMLTGLEQSQVPGGDGTVGVGLKAL